MKYSKEYETLIQDPSFPPEWRESAIEYRRLKKLIKNVVHELSDMGLSPDVLQRLLQDESNKNQAVGQASAATDTILLAKDTHSEEDATLEDLEFEYESDEDDGETRTSPPRSQRVLSINSPRRFRVRLKSQGEGELCEGPVKRTLNVKQALDYGEGGSVVEVGDSDAEARLRHTHKTVKRAAEVKAQYVFAGPLDHPVPQFRLSLPNSRSTSPTRAQSGSSRSSSVDASKSLTPSTGETSEDSEDEDRETTPTGILDRDPDLSHSPRLGRVKDVSSPIWAITSGTDNEGFKSLSDDLAALNLGVAALEYPLELKEDRDDTIDVSTPGASAAANKEILITLPSDVAFFNLLTEALSGLSALHESQQALFKASVARLCKLISASITPESGPKPLRTVNNAMHKVKMRGKGKEKVVPSTALDYTKSDLYAWREIFTLWIEAQIFESSSERDRGERSVDEAEKRLQAFAAEVVKKGLGDRRTLSRKESREAWAEFLRLNVLLLDLKRFQLANINAARKILKKHDKRTALTATTGFANFVRSALDADTKNSSSWAAYNTSLPHILLASMTDTLLPILPSLEDYTCLICTSIAFKPIRLSCGHLFCVRCLAKMQRAGKAECPLCRAKTVLMADKTSLDTSLMNFMVEWFPLEVKEKQKSNEKEIALQQVTEMGMDPRCIIM